MHSENPALILRRHTVLLSMLCTVFMALTPVGVSAQNKQDNQPDAVPAPTQKVSEDSITPIKILYSGKLQDSDGEPISGVFPLTFKIYKHHMATDSLWHEEHFVAVVDGHYSLELGTLNALTLNQLEGNRWMGVEFATEGEILRDRLIVSLVDPTQPGGRIIIGSGTDSSSRNTTFAEVSERANFAEHAAVADRSKKLGDLDAEAIEKLSNLALERLGEHIADPDAHKGGQKSGVSTERKVMQPAAGGRGGEPYKIQCPPGFVMTGIEGRAGRVVDSLQVVCSPIQ